MSSYSNNYYGSLPKGWAQQEVYLTGQHDFSWASSDPYHTSAPLPIATAATPANTHASFVHGSSDLQVLAAPLDIPFADDSFTTPLDHQALARPLHTPVANGSFVPPLDHQALAPPLHTPVANRSFTSSSDLQSLALPLHAPVANGCFVPSADLQTFAPPVATPVANQFNPSSSVMYTTDTDLTFSNNKPIPVKTTSTKRRACDPEAFGAEAVDARFPVIGVKSKCILDVAEIKRRCSKPEEMNFSTLAMMFRKCRGKKATEQLKKLLNDHGIEIPFMQRQMKLNCFSPLLEQEAVQLSNDVKMLTDKYYPTETVAISMLRQMLEQGKHPQQCLEQLNNSILAMNKLITILENRQPMVSGQAVKVKNNALDEKYEKFSRLTHGYGHTNSLAHYTSFRKIFECAAKLAHGLLDGQPIKPKVLLKQGEEPWRLPDNTKASKRPDGR